MSFNSSVDSTANNTITKIAIKIHYCIAKFPSPNMEITLTIYTVLISYVLPLSTIIFCYARMIIKIIKNSKSQSLTEEYKYSYSANNKSTLRLKDSNSTKNCIDKVCFLLNYFIENFLLIVSIKRNRLKLVQTAWLVCPSTGAII